MDCIVTTIVIIFPYKIVYLDSKIVAATMLITYLQEVIKFNDPNGWLLLLLLLDMPSVA